MTYDYTIDLVNTDGTVNDIGDVIEPGTKRSVFASILTYRNKNYYEAMSSGLKPVITFAVNKHEYGGEKTIEYDSSRYKVIDVLPVSAKDESEFDAISLLCEKVAK
jgi:hypothetical protein